MKRRGWVVGAVVLAVLAGGTVLVLQRRTGTGPGATTASATGLRPGPPIYLDRAFSPAERAADLVSRLTLAEKAAQLVSNQAAAIPRLGVEAYGWWNEAAHGVARESYVADANPPELKNTTSYPVDLSMASTWDRQLMHDQAALISDEAREVVRKNRLDLNFYSPTVNLARDPRWGRNDETFGEDPLLTAELAAQYVDGMEGKDADGELPKAAGGYLKTLTTLKHYAANNSETNRLDGSSDMDARTLREYYTAQFRGIVRRSHPQSMMSAYNEVNGIPAAADPFLMDALARQTFGFTGYFTSDCDAVQQIEAGHHWTPPNDSSPVDRIGRTAYAHSAGEDLDCNQGYHDDWNYANTVPDAVAAKVRTLTDTYNENDVDVSAVRLFTARIGSGEFDAEASVPWVTAARARVAAGSWQNVDDNHAVTQTPQRLAMARRSAGESIVLLKNDQVAGKAPVLPLKVPSSGPFRLAVIGQYASPPKMYLGGYSSDQDQSSKARQVTGYQGLKAAVQAIDPAAVVDYLPGTKPGFSGTDPTHPFVVDTATVDPVSVKAAAGYDAVIVYAGTDTATAAEDGDRRTLDLPGAQADLIAQVAAANPRTAVYLETVGQVDVRPFVGKVPALLWSSYNGQRKGEGLADVVLGRVNPSGHLPFSWYADETQLPPITDYAIRPAAGKAGRTYQYFTGGLSFPFGHGLGYSTFRTAGLKVGTGDPGMLKVTADVTNSGPVAGRAVIQLYVATPDAAPAKERPRKRLAGFASTLLAPGASGPVSFTVNVRDLAFWDDAAGRFIVDPGRYQVQLASSADDRDVQQRADVRLDGALPALPSVLTAKPVATGDAERDIAQRVLFGPGVELDPQLTLAMTDDTLTGYVRRGAGRPLPADAKVRFTSNRPDVVEAGADGTIRTRGTGVATVTATLELRGSTVRTTFVVGVR